MNDVANAMEQFPNLFAAIIAAIDEEMHENLLPHDDFSEDEIVEFGTQVAPHVYRIIQHYVKILEDRKA